MRVRIEFERLPAAGFKEMIGQLTQIIILKLLMGIVRIIDLPDPMVFVPEINRRVTRLVSTAVDIVWVLSVAVIRILRAGGQISESDGARRRSRRRVSRGLRICN